MSPDVGRGVDKASTLATPKAHNPLVFTLAIGQCENKSGPNWGKEMNPNWAQLLHPMGQSFQIQLNLLKSVESIEPTESTDFEKAFSNSIGLIDSIVFNGII